MEQRGSLVLNIICGKSHQSIWFNSSVKRFGTLIITIFLFALFFDDTHLKHVFHQSRQVICNTEKKIIIPIEYHELFIKYG